MVETPAPPRRRLPRIPADAVRFAGVGAVTFLVDLAVLAALRAWTSWPLPPAVAAGYATAFALSFVLNRAFTFRSHGPVRGQVGRWLVVVAGDFSLTVGGTTALAAAGLDVRRASGGRRLRGHVHVLGVPVVGLRRARGLTVRPPPSSGRPPAA